ncbi:MAG: hypothetical protein IIC96_04775 [Chloroflexi bacterium]|nr:hypothetical protein [Chloroflexota bacterium]MCI0858036.1 hypothetical protein [Chloroflexota bacterium]
MVLLDIRQAAVVGRVDEDKFQATLDREVEDALLGSVDSREATGVETGNWSYSMPSPGVRYYAFYGPAKPKAAPRYGVGGGLPR